MPRVFHFSVNLISLDSVCNHGEIQQLRTETLICIDGVWGAIVYEEGAPLLFPSADSLQETHQLKASGSQA